jgi:hypothetical protein
LIFRPDLKTRIQDFKDAKKKAKQEVIEKQQ